MPLENPGRSPFGVDVASLLNEIGREIDQRMNLMQATDKERLVYLANLRGSLLSAVDDTTFTPVPKEWGC